MTDTAALIEETARRAAAYLAGLDDRRVLPDAEMLAALPGLGGPVPEGPSDPLDTLRLLDDAGSPATVASAGGRYFGFVIGGALPATLAAGMLATAWDQNAAKAVMSPAAAAVEEVAARWTLDLLGLPAEASVGFVTGATMANFTCLAAARHRLLAGVGWDAERDGLFGAPEIEVVVGDEVHVSVLKALAMLGLGAGRLTRVPVDAMGRMRADALPPLGPTTLLILQAGNVNGGGGDPIDAIIDAADGPRNGSRDSSQDGSGAWVHVDGAFGLWLAASPRHASEVAGIERAHSWATDAHKWLNVPYDSGLAIVRDGAALTAAMAASAAYLVEAEQRDGADFTPDLSRRARGIEVWAALRSLGRSGLADLIERHCRQARRFADGLSDAGFEVLNDVVANQVVVAFGDDAATDGILAAIQAEGTCWFGPTSWRGRRAARISVSSWATTDDDVERSLDAIVRVARGWNGPGAGG